MEARKSGNYGSKYLGQRLCLVPEKSIQSMIGIIFHQRIQRLNQITDPSLPEQVKHALELPLHWRIQKLEAKWFIHAYEARSDANHILLQLVKLDFNMVQATYQDEIKPCQGGAKQLVLQKS